MSLKKKNSENNRIEKEEKRRNAGNQYFLIFPRSFSYPTTKFILIDRLSSYNNCSQFGIFQFLMPGNEKSSRKILYKKFLCLQDSFCNNMVEKKIYAGNHLLFLTIFSNLSMANKY